MPAKLLKKNWLCFILVLSMLFMIAAPAAATARPQEKQSVLIGFNQAPQAAEQALLRAHNAKVLKQYTIIPAMLIEVPVQAIAGLQHNPLVDYVEPDAPVYAVGETIPWGVQRVKAPDVWNLQVTGSGVDVAVLDTGIGPHDDLNVAGRVNFAEGSFDADVDGHGTHVAGTIAAVDNEMGVIGVAPAVNLYAVKVLGDDGSGTVSTVVAGIDWAANNGMDIINMSLGSSQSSTTLENACNAAYNKGVLLVASAGNSGNRNGKGDNVGYPARYESVIAVAATDSSDNRAYFSSTGPAVELAAPGASVYSTYRNNGYAYLSGTSMASPHVAAVAALVKAADPSLTNTQIRQILTSTATDLGLRADHQGYGLVNALAAVQAAQGTTEPTIYTVSGTVTDTGATALSGATVSTGAVSVTTDVYGYYEMQLAAGDYTLTASASGYESQTKTTTVQANTTVDFALTKSTTTTPAYMTNSLELASKYYGRFKDVSVTVRVVSGDLPVANATVSLDFTQPDNKTVTFNGITAGDGTVTFTLKKVSSGTYSATVTGIVHDSYLWDKSNSTTSGTITLQ